MTTSQIIGLLILFGLAAIYLFRRSCKYYIIQRDRLDEGWPEWPVGRFAHTTTDTDQYTVVETDDARQLPGTEVEFVLIPLGSVNRVIAGFMKNGKIAICSSTKQASFLLQHWTDANPTGKNRWSAAITQRHAIRTKLPCDSNKIAGRQIVGVLDFRCPGI